MGDNIFLGDRNGVRTPMQWSADRNAGFSRANSQRLYLPVIIDPGYSYESVNVEAQEDNPHSLLWWNRRLIALRQRFRAFGRGTLEMLYPANRKVLAFVRRYQDEQILVVANLSRYVQYVELDLSAFRDLVPVELFGQAEFPAVGERPYLLTLGPHSFYWFALQPQRREFLERTEQAVPAVAFAGSSESLLRGRGRAALESALPSLLAARRWFLGRGRTVKTAKIADVVSVGSAAAATHLALVTVEYAEGDPETYQLALGVAVGERARQLRETAADSVMATLGARDDAVLYGALEDKGFATALLEAVTRRRRLKGATGDVVAVAGPGFRFARGSSGATLEPSVARADQHNTSVRYGEQFILKVFRRVDPGVNPEVEMLTFLSQTVGFPHVPPLAGWLEHQRRGGGDPITLGVLQVFVPHEGDAWQLALDGLSRYFERVRARRAELAHLPRPHAWSLELIDSETPPLAQELLGTDLEPARLLGQRTAELHLALTSHPEDPAFAPEPFTPFYQRSLFQSIRNVTEQTFQLLRRRLPELSGRTRAAAERIAGVQGDVLRRCRGTLDRKHTAVRARIHGDFHLGQALWTGRDFVFIDFEGDVTQSLSSRRIRRSPLRDVASMIRSFHHAAAHALLTLITKGAAHAEDEAALEPWAEYWYAWVASAFLRSYLQTAASGGFLPHARDELKALLIVYMLEKAVTEIAEGLHARSESVRLPMQQVAQLLEEAR
jgi:maltose alpha-D-glucosyltransferase/alpha-amylase